MKVCSNGFTGRLSLDSAPRRVAIARGFTLIELVIVVAIVAILAAIALPSYRQQVLKAHRSQAKADLLEYSQGLERYYSVNRTYVGAALPFAVSPRDGAGGSPYYNLALNAVAGPPSTYTITATPINSQTGDVRCGTLTVNQLGQKFYSGTGDDNFCGFGVSGP
jgi:type IV pilus assembly protein PilE